MTFKKLFKKYGIVTLVEAASVTNFKADTLKKRIQHGKLEGIKVGTTWLIFLKDLKNDTK